MKLNILVISLIAAGTGLFGCSDSTNKDGQADAGNNRVTMNNDTLPSSDGGATDGEAPDATIIEDSGVPIQCNPGTVTGCADDTHRSVCADSGSGVVSEACPQGQWCLLGECGDQRCVPGTLSCADPSAMQTCNSAGDGWENLTTCEDGTVCEGGTCRSICDLGGKGPSYIGCEYWTVDLDQYTDPSTNPKPDEVPHAVVISNPGPRPATINFIPRRAGVTINVPDPVVPVGEARAFEMPRLDVDGSSLSFNAIQILSSNPVIAHQFNPLNNERVYSNDASLLLPVSSQGKEYYVINWPSQILPCFMQFCPESQHSYVTIIATTPGRTNLSITSTARIMPGDGVPNVSPGAPRGFQLVHGQVLNLQAGDENATGANDLTGTHIISDQPIAVFAGHEEAVIGNLESERESCCADHLEQQLFPVETWGSDYIAVRSPDRGDNEDHWRIVAAEDATTLTTNPPQPGANGVTLNKGDAVKFFSKESFEISGGGKKISVGQFLVSQGQTLDVTGDPAFILLVPASQYRSDYHLLTPQGYGRDYVVVVRPVGASVELDGAVVTEPFTPVAGGTYETATVQLQPGVHVLEGNEPFGIQAYGFNNAVSYGYPGGLNLVGVDDPGPGGP